MFQWGNTFTIAREKARDHFLRHHVALVKHRWTSEAAIDVRECLLISTADKNLWQAIPLDGKGFLAFDARDPEKSAMVAVEVRRKSDGVIIRGPWSGRFEVDGKRGEICAWYNSQEIKITFVGESRSFRLHFLVLFPYPMKTHDFAADLQKHYLVEEGDHAGLKLQAFHEAMGPLVNIRQVSCPSMVFVILQKSCNAGLYAHIKWLSESVLGTQVSVRCCPANNHPCTKFF